MPEPSAANGATGRSLVAALKRIACGQKTVEKPVHVELKKANLPPVKPWSAAVLVLVCESGWNTPA